MFDETTPFIEREAQTKTSARYPTDHIFPTPCEEGRTHYSITFDHLPGPRSTSNPPPFRGSNKVDEKKMKRENCLFPSIRHGDLLLRDGTVDLVFEGAQISSQALIQHPLPIRVRGSEEKKRNEGKKNAIHMEPVRAKLVGGNSVPRWHRPTDRRATSRPKWWSFDTRLTPPYATTNLPFSLCLLSVPLCRQPMKQHIPGVGKKSTVHSRTNTQSPGKPGWTRAGTSATAPEVVNPSITGHSSVRTSFRRDIFSSCLLNTSFH